MSDDPERDDDDPDELEPVTLVVDDGVLGASSDW